MRNPTPANLLLLLSDDTTPAERRAQGLLLLKRLIRAELEAEPEQAEPADDDLVGLTVLYVGAEALVAVADVADVLAGGR